MAVLTGVEGVATAAINHTPRPDLHWDNMSLTSFPAPSLSDSCGSLQISPAGWGPGDVSRGLH